MVRGSSVINNPLRDPSWCLFDVCNQIFKVDGTPVGEGVAAVAAGAVPGVLQPDVFRVDRIIKSLLP